MDRTARAMRITAALLVGTFVLVIAFAAQADAHIDDPDSGRWVILPKDHGGLTRCEAPAHGVTTSRGIDADEFNHAGGPDRGAYQFIPSTWRWVAEARGKPKLAAKSPAEVTLAQQVRQALWLQRNGGRQHWHCNTWGQGPDRVKVFDEPRMPRNPARCARNLHEDWGLSQRRADSICGVDHA